MQHAPVNRLQTIADVWQCASNDDAHCIVEIGLSHLVFETDRYDFARYVGH